MMAGLVSINWPGHPRPGIVSVLGLKSHHGGDTSLAWLGYRVFKTVLLVRAWTPWGNER